MNKKGSQAASRRVNVAIVGLGFMGVKHLQSWQRIKHARLVAVCGVTRLPVNRRIAGVSGNLAGSDGVILPQGVKVFSNFEELLSRPEIDLVDLCVPTPLHHLQGIAALKVGKHVICEKPMARTSAMAAEMVAAAREARRFLMPAMVMRFWPGWAWLKEAVNDGRYGKVLAARFQRFSEPPRWSRQQYFDGKQSGGALLDLHIHDADFVQFLFGPPLSVFAAGRTRFSGAIDHVVSQYQVSGGAVVSAEGGWLTPEGHGFNMSYTVIFEKAAADYNMARGADALLLCEAGRPQRVIKTKGSDGYVRELEYMANCIQRGEAPHLVTAEEGLNAVRICEAEEKSVKTGRAVALTRARHLT